MVGAGETGRSGAHAITGRAYPGSPDAYVSRQQVAGLVSVVLTGPHDYLLELSVDMSTTSVNRGGLGVEEALQVDVSGSFSVIVTVLACGPVPGDVDGDCATGILDLLVLLGAWGPNPGHPADFDGDDVVGILDFLTLLGDWNADANQYLLEIVAR